MIHQQTTTKQRQQALPMHRSISITLCVCVAIALYAINVATSSGILVDETAVDETRRQLFPRTGIEATSNPPVNILLGLSGNTPGFWSEVDVLLKSVLLNAPVDDTLVVHCMVDKEAFDSMLGLLERIKIRKWKMRNQVTFKLYNVQSKIEKWSEVVTKTWNENGYRRKLFRHKVGAYFRLFAAEVLPDDVEHAVYMDSDVVIMANLQDLWKYTDSTKVFQWGLGSLCSGFVMLNVRKLHVLWETIPTINLRKIGNSMGARPGDQLLFRSLNRTHPELVGALPPEWEITASNGAPGGYNKDYMSTNEDEVLRVLKKVGMLHMNGGGTSDEPFYKSHDLLTYSKYKYEHSFGLIKYYVNMPWTWARFMVESKRRGTISYSPIVQV